MADTVHPAPEPLPVRPPPEEGESSDVARENAVLARDIGKLCSAGQYDAALAKTNAVLQAEPANLFALSLRGYIHCKLQKWDEANADFNAILKVKPDLSEAKFDLAEVKFLQKDYSNARASFDELTADPNLADLAAYKVFLCDLFGGADRKAKEEYNAFNLAASDPSYYFGNAAWELYHNHPDAARPWLESATRIYYPAKLENYSRSLFDLGYLPLPPPGPSPFFAPASVPPPPAK